MENRGHKLNKLNEEGIISFTWSKGIPQIFWIGLFSVFYLMRDLLGIAFPDLVFTGICGLAFLLTDVGTSLGIFIFTTALTVPHVEIRFVYLIILVAKLALYGRLEMRAGMLLLTLGILLLQMVDILLYSVGSLYSEVYSYGVNMLTLILPLFWYGAEFSAKDYQRALLCYVAGVMLGGTVALLLTANSTGWDVLLSGKYNTRLGITENVTETMQTTYNANQLAGMFAIAAAIILVTMDYKRMPKLLALPLVGYALFIVVMTRSRTGLLLMGLIVLVYYWVTVFRRKKFWAGLWILLAMILLAVVVFNVFPGAAQAILNRFTNQDDITNGRADLFGLYLNAWSEDAWCFLFGYGIGSYSNVVDIWQAPHNMITDILICWGLLGLILILSILVAQYKKGIKRIDKKMRLLALLPAIIAVVASMAGQYLTTGYPHMRLCFLLLAAKAFTETETGMANTLEKV